jgi:hypothetical protein
MNHTEEYNRARRRVSALLVLVNRKLELHAVDQSRAPSNPGYVGDMYQYEDNLKAILGEYADAMLTEYNNGVHPNSIFGNIPETGTQKFIGVRTANGEYSAMPVYFDGVGWRDSHGLHATTGQVHCTEFEAIEALRAKHRVPAKRVRR